MDYLQNIIPPEQIYYKSITNQFNLLCESVLYNLCIVDLVKKEAFIYLYYNKLTGKTNGFYASFYYLNNTLRWCCSNKLIIIVLMVIIEDTIEIQKDTYICVPDGLNVLYLMVNKDLERLLNIKVNLEDK